MIVNIADHVAMSCDGAAAILGRHNSMAKQLEDVIQSMVSIHCHAHRLALAAADALNAPHIKPIKLIERLQIQLWKYCAHS